jgi:hypothetical protein
MKKRFTKPEHFNVDPKKPGNAKCTCIEKGAIAPTCLDNGICPTLNIISVHKGFKLTQGGKIRKGFKPFRKGIESLRKAFEQMKKKLNTITIT